MKIFTRVFALFLTLAIFTVSADAAMLIPGGQVIGLQLQDDTVSVAGFDPQLGQAAQSAGLAVGDRILQIEGNPVRCAEDIRSAVRATDGTVQLSVMRGSKVKRLKIAPAATGDGPKLGIYLRQGTTGLGTVTFYEPESGNYGALGHGVNSTDGKLLKLSEGSVYPASVQAVKRGKAGTPGQLLGALKDSLTMGDISKNSNQGIFGKLSGVPAEAPLPTASADQIHTGSAVIRSTVTGSAPREYSVEILKIYPNANDRTRNMLLKVTDKALLDATGGIVQGMSGSPIIQDGKLVGAVTHVLVNDPTTGYGIFIENMLDAAA